MRPVGARTIHAPQESNEAGVPTLPDRRVAMHKLFQPVLVVICLLYALSLGAQTPCPSLSVVVNTPEDELMLAVNGAENPQDQIAALEKFAQAHADSKFLPCVYEYLTSANVKLNNLDKAIEWGEKDVAASYADLNLTINLLKAYVGSGKAGDSAFSLIEKAPELIKTEDNPTRPAKATDEEWQKMQQETAEQAKEERAYIEYAFFQLLPRVTDPKKRLEYLDGFTKSYPDTTNASQVNFQYQMAYTLAGDAAKADEYGEKAIAADANNIEALNLVAYDYSNRRTNLDRAADYAKKVVSKGEQKSQGGNCHPALQDGHRSARRQPKPARRGALLSGKRLRIPVSARPQIRHRSLDPRGGCSEPVARAIARPSGQGQTRDRVTEG